MAKLTPTPTPKAVMILGKRWRLEFSKVPSDRDGDCSPPDRRRKRIRVRPSLRGLDRLETIIHEVMHAADWHKREEWVSDVARDLAKILSDLGYRMEGDE